MGAAELWVEGQDDQHVVWSLLRHHAVPQTFVVVDRKGIDNLMDALRVQLTVGSGVTRLGVVVDADADITARWASLRDLLERSGFRQVPEQPLADGLIIHQAERPVIGVWLMPDNSAPGMLEDFAASLIPAEDFLWSYAGSAIDGIPDDERRFSAAHRSKVHIRTWLAWQEEPGSPMGQAITKGDLDANAPGALRFVAWLRRLMVDDPPAEGAVPDAAP